MTTVLSPIRLDLNESPFGPLPSVLDALIGDVLHVNRYPEFLPNALPRMIARRHGVDPDQVVVGAGATGVVLQTLQALHTSSTSRIAYAAPTFDGYPIMAAMAGYRSCAVDLDADGRQDLDGLARTARSGAAVVVVCRPHNPTGTIFSADELMQLLHAVPTSTVVVLDEAYAEFVDVEHRLDITSLIATYRNLLVLRTFSKAYGLAGLRVGFALGSPELIAPIRRLQLPFGMSQAAGVGVSASYAAESELESRIDVIKSEREYLRSRLLSQGYDTIASHANFVYIAGAPHDAEHRLTRSGVRAKYYITGDIRLTVGTHAENDAVATALNR